MRDFEDAKREVIELFATSRWVRWIHEGFRPAYTDKEKKDNRVLSDEMLRKHCSICLNINGCCFPENNMPKYLLHPHCHCFIVPVYDLTVRAECDIAKFSDYIFHPTRNRGKKALYEGWGYDIIDSKWLQPEFISQATQKYAVGDFELGLINEYGQRISIRIIIPRKDRIGALSIITGWMVYPDGLIKLVTPYAGHDFIM